MKRRKKHWSRSLGEYGCRVRVFETASGVLYGEVRTRHGTKRRTLGHRDRDRAIAWAKEQHARLALGLATVESAIPTASRIFGLYLKHQTPRKGKSQQAHDRRAAECWERILGARKDLTRLTRREWLDFIDRRQSGAIDARGNPVTVKKRRPVRARAVANDLEWLVWVLNWAVKWQDENGRYVMRENPARGYPIPKEKNPRRSVVTQDRFEKIRKVSDRVTMEVRRSRKRLKVRSYLSELLDIVNGTGRRISAVLQLRYEDLRLKQGAHGAIRWPADTDKMGQEWVTPINAQVRRALDRNLAERPGVGRAYLFPSPRNPARPVSKDLASAWLEEAERLAEVPKQAGSLWHAYRRKWATERKHLPDQDVAAAGGWSDLTSLKTAYQQVDGATLYRVVSEPAELREEKNA
jgi:hypothetical protein